MVRTKADAATRVAAGSKAPKKIASRAQTPSPTEKLGKDNLPVNRYCPRETPAWQKKISTFFERNESKKETKASPQNNNEPNYNANRNSKRRSSEVDEDDDDMDGTEVTKKVKTIHSMETDDQLEDVHPSKETEEMEA